MLTGGGWISPSAEPRAERGLRGVAERVKVVWPRAHGDVDTLGVITSSASQSQQVEEPGVHGHAVVLGIGAV